MTIEKTNVMVPCNDDQVWCNVYGPSDYKLKQNRAIILSHGYNGFADSWDLEATYLAEHGLVVFALDFCGASIRSRSTGERTDMTLSTERENLGAVFEYVKALDYVDEEAIFLFGESQGGLISTLVTEDKLEQVRGLFLYFPALCIPENWKAMYPDLDAVPEVIEFWDNVLGKKFVEDVYNYDLDKMFGHYEGPIHVFHGDLDTVVTVAFTEKYIINKFKDAKLDVMYGQGHGFTDDIRMKNIAIIEKEISAIIMS